MGEIESISMEFCSNESTITFYFEMLDGLDWLYQYGGYGLR